MNEGREPDERYEPEEIELGEPTEPPADAGERIREEITPDAEELQRNLSETRKPMGPPLPEPDEAPDAPEADAPPPPPTDPSDPD
jgi:hypothetical protein